MINKNYKNFKTYLPRNSISSYSSLIALFFFIVTTRGENGKSTSNI